MLFMLTRLRGGPGDLADVVAIVVQDAMEWSVSVEVKWR